MSLLVGKLTSTLKKEVESDVEAVSSGDESGDETGGLPAILTTNYHDTRLPMLQDFLGPYNFRFTLPRDGCSSIKPTWEFSEMFNQVFIKVDRVLVVQFSFDSAKLNINDLYIRAVLVYSSADHIYSAVNRCAVHAIEDDPLNQAHTEKSQCRCPMFKLAGHVVRCKSVEAIYCYDPKSERHSVLCPVKSTADLLYSFHCKNSCPKGMHRRGTKLVFTLENGSGKMLGRSSVDLKVCSCPRRDMDKMEKTLRQSMTHSATGQTAQLVQWPMNASRSPTSDSPPVMIKPSSVTVQLEEGDVQRVEEEPQSIHLPGEVIMKIRSEIRNIRQVLTVAERRFTRIQEILNEPQDS